MDAVEHQHIEHWKDLLHSQCVTKRLGHIIRVLLNYVVQDLGQCCAGPTFTKTFTKIHIYGN